MMRAKWLGLLAMALALLTTGAHAQGTWKQMKPIPGGGANELLGAVMDEQLYVYGGQTPDNASLGLLLAYDAKTDQWTKLAGNPLPVHHAATAVVGHKLYLFGGFHLPGWTAESKAWVYDADTKNWAALPDMPTRRGALAAVAVGTKIYVMGGGRLPDGADPAPGMVPGGPVELLGTNEMFDTETNSWTTLKPMTLPRNHHALAAVGGKIYVVGGRVGSCYSGGNSSNISMTEAYDIAGNSWQTRAVLPTARSGLEAAVIDGKIHTLGGEGWIDDFGGVFRVHETYDPKTNFWSKDARMPTPRHGFAIGTIDGRIYAVSGINNAGGSGPFSYVDVNEAFTP